MTTKTNPELLKDKKFLSNLRMDELAHEYNTLTGKTVKGFSSKKVAVERIMKVAKAQTVITKMIDATAAKNGKGKTDTKLKNLKTMSARSVRQVAEEMLLRDEPAMTYEEIVMAVKAELPHASTTVACLRWYATQLREREPVPDRPRKPRGVTILN